MSTHHRQPPALQTSLFSGSDAGVATWDDWVAPVGYEQTWGQLRRASEVLGLGPDELRAVDEHGVTGYERLVAERRWKSRTAVLYAKVAGYGGLVLPRRATPEPSVGIENLGPLVGMADDASLVEVRAVAWCALALGWPAPLDAWRSLRITDVQIVGSDVVVVDRRVKGAAIPWGRWLEQRRRIGPVASSPWALCTVREGGWPDEQQGNPLSRRALQDAFQRHVGAVSARLTQSGRSEANIYRALNYDTLRRLVITSGVDPVDRGRVRAQRSLDPRRPQSGRRHWPSDDPFTA